MVTPDMDEITIIPGYKVIVKAILKNQIQQLVDQLATTTDEECVILTASLTDDSCSQLGSDFGVRFLEGREDIKSQFLDFCLNKQNKQQENKNQNADNLQVCIQSSPVYMSVRSPRSDSLQTAQDRSKGRLDVRYQPYPITRPKSSAMTLDPACEPGQNNVIKELDEHMIKIEPNVESQASYLSESDKPSTTSNIIIEAPLHPSSSSYFVNEANSKDKDNVVDDPVPQPIETNSDSEIDNDNDETYPPLSVKLEVIADLLKTFAEHDTELECKNVERMGTIPETEPSIIGVDLPTKRKLPSEAQTDESQQMTKRKRLGEKRTNHAYMPVAAHSDDQYDSTITVMQHTLSKRTASSQTEEVVVLTTEQGLATFRNFNCEEDVKEVVKKIDNLSELIKDKFDNSLMSVSLLENMPELTPSAPALEVIPSVPAVEISPSPLAQMEPSVERPNDLDVLTTNPLAISRPVVQYPADKKCFSRSCYSNDIVVIGVGEVPSDESRELRVHPDIQRKLKTLSCSLGNFGWLLAKQLFSDEELNGKNYRGRKGKEMLSPRRIHAIEHAAFDSFGEGDNVRLLASGINTGIRNMNRQPLRQVSPTQ